MDVEVGSNLYRNSDGTIEIEGVPQIQVALKPTTGALLVNFALFDATGQMMAKVVDSTLMFNERRAYDVTKTPKASPVTHVASGTSRLTDGCEGARCRGLYERGVPHDQRSPARGVCRPNGKSISSVHSGIDSRS